MVPSVKRTRLPPTSVTAKAPGVLGGWSAVLPLTRMSSRLLQRRLGIRGGEGSASLHRCEE